MSDHRTVAWIFDVGIRHISRVHVIATTHVVGLASAHGTHDRHVMHLLRHLGHVLADRNAVGGCRYLLKRTAGCRTGLEIPNVHCAWAASHPEQNGRLVSLAQIGRIGQNGVRKRRSRCSQGSGPGEVTHEMASVHTLRNAVRSSGKPV